MKLSITREEYEELRKNPNPYIKLDMECQYFVEVLSKPNGKAKRRSPKGRRSPTDMLRLTDKAARRNPSTAARRDAQRYLLDMQGLAEGVALQSAMLGKRLAGVMDVSNDMGSYYVSMAVKDNILEVVND